MTVRKFSLCPPYCCILLSAMVTSAKAGKKKDALIMQIFVKNHTHQIYHRRDYLHVFMHMHARYTCFDKDIDDFYLRAHAPHFSIIMNYICSFCLCLNTQVEDNVLENIRQQKKHCSTRVNE